MAGKNKREQIQLLSWKTFIQWENLDLQMKESNFTSLNLLLSNPVGFSYLDVKTIWRQRWAITAPLSVQLLVQSLLPQLQHIFYQMQALQPFPLLFQAYETTGACKKEIWNSNSFSYSKCITVCNQPHRPLLSSIDCRICVRGRLEQSHPASLEAARGTLASHCTWTVCCHINYHYVCKNREITCLWCVFSTEWAN